MSEKNWMEQAQERMLLSTLDEMNGQTQKYGLVLSREDAQMLVAERQHTLREQRRVEFGESILPKLIFEFCDSAYLDQRHYAETIARLQEIFFSYKNEMMDEITDEELLHFMREQFDTVCHGDLDYLEGTCLEVFAQAIRAGYRGHHRTAGRAEYAQFDPVPRWDRELYLQALEELEE